MSTIPLHYSQCGQPSLLPSPEIQFPVSNFQNMGMPYEEIYYTALNSDAPIVILIIAIIASLAALALYYLKGKRLKILFGIPVIVAALMVITDKVVELSVPRNVESLITQHQYHKAIDVLNFMNNTTTQARSFSVLPDFVIRAIEEHQLRLRQFNSYVLAHGIKHYLSSNQTDKALTLSDKTIQGETYTEDNNFRALANWEASRLAYLNADAYKTLDHAKIAYDIFPDQTTYNLLMTATAIKIISGAQRVANGHASYETLPIEELSPKYQPDKQRKILEYIARYIFIKAVEGDQIVLKNSRSYLIETYKNLLERHDYVAGKSGISATLQCDLAGLFNAVGTVAIKEGRTEKAVSDFLEAEKLLLDSPYTTEMLPIAYNADGNAKLIAGNNNSSVTAFKQAYQRDSTPENGCNVAIGLNAIAMDEGAQKNFEKAHEHLLTADRFCTGLDRTKLTRALLHLSQGELALSSGQFSTASYHFDRARKHQKIRHLADNHAHHLPILKSAFDKIRLIKGVYTLPKPDGLICATDDGKFCENLLLMKNNHPYGSVNYALNEIHIKGDEEGNHRLEILDTNKDGYFDQWSDISKYSRYTYRDIDRDGRPDWLSRFSEGKLVEEKPLSGVVLISLSAAINTRADLFSEPDSYYKAYKNGRFIGRSDPALNQTYAVYKQLFIINYKYGDEVRLEFFDKDLFWDDKLGVARIEELPTNRYLFSDNQKVAIAMKVDPADAPEGTYLASDDLEQVNPFLAESWLHESSELAKIIQASRQKQASSQFSASLASFVLPEAIISLTIRRLTLFNALISGVAGHQVTHEALTHTN